MLSRAKTGRAGGERRGAGGNARWSYHQARPVSALPASSSSRAFLFPFPFSSPLSSFLLFYLSHRRGGVILGACNGPFRASVSSKRTLFCLRRPLSSSLGVLRGLSRVVIRFFDSFSGLWTVRLGWTEEHTMMVRAGLIIHTQGQTSWGLFRYTSLLCTEFLL